MSSGISIVFNIDGTISIDKEKFSTRLKRNKGNSLIDTPLNYTVIDIETTGLDPQYDEIIEIGAIKIRNSEVIDTFESLVKPEGYYSYDDENNEFVEYVDEFITELTGITNEMLQSAPNINHVLKDFMEFIKDDILIGHNVNFDINFLYDSFEKETGHIFNNNFIDLMRLSRKLYPEFKNHKLKTVANNLKVDTRNNHRALNDCYITLNCFKITSNYVLEKNLDLKEMFSSKYGYVDLRTIEASNSEFNKEHILFDKNCTFTGKLEKMERKHAAQIVVDLGGKCLNSVTKKSNFLILGNFDYNATVKDGKSSKLKKAENLILEGQDLQILSENVFYDLVLND